MRMKSVAFCVVLLLTGSVGFANEWVADVEVVKLGTYQHSAAHFVWLSSGSPAECQSAVPQNPTLGFLDSEPGGTSMFATLTTALVKNRKVDVQVNRCEIVEVYLR